MTSSAGRTDTALAPEVLLQAAYLAGDNPALLVEWRSRRILACNGAVERVFGYRPAELVGQSTRILHISESRFQGFGERSEEVLLAKSGTFHGHSWLRRRDGAAVPTEILIQLIRDDAGQPFAGLSIMRDLTETQPAANCLTDFGCVDVHCLSEQLPGAVFQRVRTVEGEDRYTYLAGDLVRSYGVNTDDIRADPETLFQLLHPDDRSLLESEIDRSHEHLTPMELELRFHAPDGSRVWVRTIAQPRRLDDGSTVWDGCALDITREKEAENRIHYLATHDPLTGLANRLCFVESVRDAIERTPAGASRLAVAHIDVGRMMFINESRGSRVGDELLVRVAERLVDATRLGDLVGRSYSDVFLVLLALGTGETELQRTVDRLRALFSEPFELADGTRLDLTANIGVALYPEDGDQAEALVRASNVSLSRAKRQYDEDIAFYSHDLSEQVQARFSREQELRAALEQEEFIPYYQPQVSLADGSLVGLEVLARWPTSEGMVSPREFIPLAEELGLIGTLGTQVLRRVVRQVTAWRDAGLRVPLVVVNASAKQLRQPDFVDQYRRALDEQGADPELIGLEITESSLLEDFKTTRAAMGALAELGVQLSIDDFGTGFSSLSRLAHLPLDILKIDRSFVWSLESGLRQRSIVEGLIRMAKALDLHVIAEAVETEAQADWLRRHGCDAAQGFLYSAALPASQAEAWLGPPE
ncbi:MAG: EAL domain-containing protein [Gammaproteobacteria bacterium]|nr:EAL domain-containing protein [Gammaproteobacteria bacterium]